jgi:DedD protein
MPFFNLRRTGTAAHAAGAAAQTESAEVVRRRAKHRLIGSAVLVLAGVLGFPLLFDTQPRPVSVDIPIDIPAKASVKPLTLPPASTPAQATPVLKPPAPDKPAAAAQLPKEEVVAPKAAPVEPAAVKAPAPDESARRAKAPAGKPESAAASKTGASEGRLVVQVGAFTDAVKAREARVKLEKAGLKTYTQVTETREGKRVRVRVGPFANRADAEKAASKIKALDLPASILAL